MRPARVFRWIFRIFLFVLTLSVTLVSFLGGLSAVQILSNPDNIQIGTDDVDFNMKINDTTYEIQDLNFTLPFNITNAGFFDLMDLKLRFEIGLLYSHVNLTGDGLNKTNFVKIFDNFTNFDTIKKGRTLRDNYTGEYTNFFDLPDPLDIDPTRVPIFELYANFTISLSYSLGLHSLSLGVYNISIYQYPP